MMTDLGANGIEMGHLWRILVPIVLMMGAAALDDAPKSLKAESGDYCYFRCLARCVKDQGNSPSTKDCESKCAQYDNGLCTTGDSNCWRTCKNTLDPSDQSKIPVQPHNVTVSYATRPQPTPWEAEVEWHPVENARLYIVQYVDKTDAFKTWAKGGLGINVSYTTHWKFVKPNLCPQYAFRVATVNENGVSVYSEIVNLQTPKPAVPAAQYSVRSAELHNVPLIDPSIDNVPLDNSTVQLVISFAPPPNWNMKTEIKRVSANLHVVICERLSAFTPYIRWKTGEPEFEVRLPGSVASKRTSCKMIFSVENLYTKCNEAEGVPYQELSNDPNSDHSMFPGFTFDLSCSNIRHSVCPYVPVSSDPSCGATYHMNTYREGNSSHQASAIIEFGPLLAPKDAPLLHYLIRYGENIAADSTLHEAFRMPNITDNIQILELHNGTREFNISNLDILKSYGFQICAIYNAKSLPNWHNVGVYSIDLTSLIRPDDLATDHARVRANDYRVATYVAAVAVPIIVTLAIALAAFLCIILRQRRAKSIDQLKVRPGGYDDDRYIDLPNKLDKWEIDRQHLVIYENEKLGSGAFGSVFKCKLLCPDAERRNGARSVLAEYRARVESGEAAVKLLPEFADETSKSDFRREINLMKKLGYHERLVNMVGCVTASEPLCLVVEYCQDGDLLHYLRDRRNYMIKMEENGIDLNNLKAEDKVDFNFVLCFKDLLAFSWQISVGLEYLSQKGYIHRDVAARNVLVDKGKRAKIGDFGLCRYSVDDSVYLSRGGRLPVKWMAIEAIKNYEFTTKSDVWSYGILLFEIITMGGNPYPGVQITDLEAYLEAGNRMEQPDNCPPVIYNMMLDCWRTCADDRPTFTQLRERLRVLLEEVTFDYDYLNLNQARDYYNMVPMEYPPLGAVQPHLLRTSDDPVALTMEGESQRAGTSTSDAQNTVINNTSTNEANVTQADSTVSTPSATLTPSHHRDSTGSEQFLITPTTPKFKFFKFKTPKTELAVLPETTSVSSGSLDGQQSTDGLSFSNGAYLEDLLPKDSLDRRATPQAVS